MVTGLDMCKIEKVDLAQDFIKTVVQLYSGH